MHALRYQNILSFYFAVVKLHRMDNEASLFNIRHFVWDDGNVFTGHTYDMNIVYFYDSTQKA